jgi:hypothetical protein
LGEQLFLQGRHHIAILGMHQRHRAKLCAALERGEHQLERPTKPQRTDERRTPLLNWSSRSVTGGTR